MSRYNNFSGTSVVMGEVVAWVRTFPVRAIRRAITNFDDLIKITSSEKNEKKTRRAGGKLIKTALYRNTTKTLNFQILL